MAALAFRLQLPEVGIQAHPTYLAFRKRNSLAIDGCERLPENPQALRRGQGADQHARTGRARLANSVFNPYPIGRGFGMDSGLLNAPCHS